MTQVVPHSLATHHHVFRGPRGSERREPGTEPSPVSSDWGADVSPGYMPTRSAGPRDPGSGDLHAGSVATSAYSPYYHPLRSRSGRNSTDSSVERPLLLRPEVALAADTNGHDQEGVDSPASSVMGAVSASPHHRSVRSRARGPYRRDLVEEVDETNFYLSPHARRSLAVQEAWKAVERTKRPSWTMERMLGEVVRGLVLEGLEERAVTRRGRVVAVGWLCRLCCLLLLLRCRVCGMLLA